MPLSSDTDASIAPDIQPGSLTAFGPGALPTGSALDGLLVSMQAAQQETFIAMKNLSVMSNRISAMLGGSVVGSSTNTVIPGPPGSAPSIADAIRANTTGSAFGTAIGGSPQASSWKYDPEAQKQIGPTLPDQSGGKPVTTPGGNTVIPPKNQSPQESLGTINGSYGRGHSLQGISKSLLENDRIAGALENTRLGGAVTDLAGGSGLMDSVGSIFGDTAAGSRLGPIGAAAGLALGATDAASHFISGQRAENAQFQSIEGGSNLGGLVERGRQAAYQWSMSGDMTSADANKAFMGVTQLGWTGGQRQQGLDFIAQQYNNLGMSVSDALNLISVAANKGIKNLSGLSDSLSQVSSTAASAGINANVARSAFASQYASGLDAGAGSAGAAAQAMYGVNATNRLGLTNQGVAVDNSSVSLQQRLSAFSGGKYSVGDIENMLSNNDPKYNALHQQYARSMNQSAISQFDNNPQFMAFLAKHQGTTIPGSNIDKNSTVQQFRRLTGWSDNYWASLYAQEGGIIKGNANPNDTAKAGWVINNMFNAPDSLVGSNYFKKNQNKTSPAGWLGNLSHAASGVGGFFADMGSMMTGREDAWDATKSAWGQLAKTGGAIKGLESNGIGNIASNWNSGGDPTPQYSGHNFAGPSAGNAMRALNPTVHVVVSVDPKNNTISARQMDPRHVPLTPTYTRW